jgi:hypothetical protein
LAGELEARKRPLSPTALCLTKFSMQVRASYIPFCCSHLKLVACLLLPYVKYYYDRYTGKHCTFSVWWIHHTSERAVLAGRKLSTEAASADATTTAVFTTLMVT